MAEKRTFKLHQDKPVLSQLDLGAATTAHGDMLAFEASVSGDNDIIRCSDRIFANAGLIAAKLLGTWTTKYPYQHNIEVTETHGAA
jgi:hypothetical protein